MRKKRLKQDYEIWKLPRYLQGPAQNRFGGLKTQIMRGFKGNTYGPASRCKVYTKEERQLLEQELKKKGIIEKEKTDRTSKRA